MKSNSKNLRRKIKTAHLTIKGHEKVAHPYPTSAYSTLFVCQEVGENNGTPHTHIGLELNDPRSANEIIKDYTKVNPNRGHIDLGTANALGTIIGYHTGFGNKCACNPRPTFIVPANFDIDSYIKNR